MGRDRTPICSVGVRGNRPIFALALTCLAVSVVMVRADQPATSAPARNVDLAQTLVALDPRWMVAFDTALAAPVGFDEQAAYVPLKGGELVAVGLDRGDVRWKVELTTPFTPATGDGLVFAAEEATVLAFQDESGATVWRTALGGPLAGPLSFDAGTVVVSKTDGELVALRAQDGAILWRRAIGAPQAVRPSAAGDRLYVGLKDGRVLAIDRESGDEIWTYTVGDEVTGLLALDDQVIVGTTGNHVYSLRSDKGRLRWRQRVGADVKGPAVADDKRIYFAALDNVLRAVDRKNGNLRWTQPLPSRPSGGPLRTGAVVIVPTVSADIGVYNAETGKPAFTIKATGELGGVPFLRETTGPTAPRLVAVSREGTLQGFAPRYEPPPVPFSALPGPKVGG
jgi:outer membrane protein assembly factor BamB